MTKLNAAALILLPSLFLAPAAKADSYSAKPCGLLSDKTVSAVFQQAMAVAPAELAHTSGQCSWTSGGKSLVEVAEMPQGLTLVLRLEQDGSPGWGPDAEQLDTPGRNATRITGLGDRAVWIAHNALGAALIAQKGGNIIELQVTAADVSRKDAATAGQMQALAKEVLTHLR